MKTNTPSGGVGQERGTAEGPGRGRILIAAFILGALPAVILFASSGRLDW